MVQLGLGAPSACCGPLRERSTGGRLHSWEPERQRDLGRCCGTGHEAAGAARDFCKSCPSIRLSAGLHLKHFFPYARAVPEKPASPVLFESWFWMGARGSLLHLKFLAWKMAKALSLPFLDCNDVFRKEGGFSFSCRSLR